MQSADLAARPSQGVSRRTALKLAAAGVPVAAGLALPATASAAPGRPTGADYVRYEDLYRSGDTFQGVINRVTGNRILTLPAGTFTMSDFTQGYYDGIRVGTGSSSGCRGIAGSGRSTIIRINSNTASRDKGSRMAGQQLTISSKSNAVLSNFTLKGGPQNGLYYKGISVQSCPDAKLSWLYLQGASRGYANSPPGETFGISVLRSDRTTISDTEIDGRDDAGTRVGASPIGWNTCSDAKIYRAYAHHGVAGMVTFWETTNIYTEDFKCFSTSSGSGSLSGSGINHEQSKGIIQHVRPTLLINGQYTSTADHTAASGPHLSFANVDGDVPTITITEPTWDKNASSSGMFCLAIRDGYHIGSSYQKIKTPPKVIKNNISLTASHHPTAGWGSKDPARYYGWIH